MRFAKIHRRPSRGPRRAGPERAGPERAGLARAGIWAAAVTCLALLAAACSGDPAHPGAGSPNGAGSGLKYSRCMRAHGITNFPDPNAQGGISISSGNGINPNSPQFRAAQRVCQPLMGSGHLSPAQQAEMQSRLLKFAQCMRTHGVPGYPDPTFGPNGYVSQKISKGEADPNSPQFRAAQRACQAYRGPLKGGPGGPGGGPGVNSSGGGS